MEKIKTEEKDKRPDIFVLATAYSGVLKARKPFLVPENEYHLKESNRINANSVKTENASRSSDKKEFENIQAEASKDAKNLKNEPSRIKSNSVDKTNMIQSNLQLSNKRIVKTEGEQNGVETSRPRVLRSKEEKTTSENTVPVGKEDKLISKIDSEKVINTKDDKRERREERHEKSGLSSSDREGSESNRDSHSYRRSLEVLGETEREHKRRRTEGSSSRSPREPVDRDARVVEKVKDDERNGREKSVVETKTHKEADLVLEKSKTKEKKANRKRDYPEENIIEPRRRRVKVEKDDDDSGKRSVDGERETKTRREEKSPLVYASNSDRRVERDEKKHHRSTSASSVKKRT